MRSMEEIAAQGEADALRDSPKLVPLTVWVNRREKEELRRFARVDGSSVSCQARRALRNYASEVYAEAAAIVQSHYDKAYADAAASSRELEPV